ncbi:zinc finger protein GAI-ASSOCIATED FACTOR 1-like [Lotus japonicus]|uniref:zinc finger protein GAI-ASSOCIATED FACTOR 1-like n=1 Tax=Lotus japonicus TaxID=34305 RepID=UPI00258F7BE2|nr:zinc finger protein GAI-ASSOCIATED FACTOR 1-like [Lotus japonicus]
MSNITSCDSGSFSTENNRGDNIAVKKQQPEIFGQFHSPHSHASTTTTTTTNKSNGSNTNLQPSAPAKRKRSLPGNPDPSAEVIALSPTTLMATNRFVCEICNKGFQRDQNLQLHRRGHNLPWKLKQRTTAEVRKRVYVCPEPSCVHHSPARALGDLTGIKKHFCRKHGEKKWKCDKCSKKYAVQSDWRAHSKICGTKEYKCDCGTIFSRRDSFITHRAFCDALSEENHKANEQGQLPPNIMQPIPINTNPNPQMPHGAPEFNHSDQKHPSPLPLPLPHELNIPMFSRNSTPSTNIFDENGLHMAAAAGSPHMSATALLQKAAQMGATVSEGAHTNMAPPPPFSAAAAQQQQQLRPDGHSFMNQLYMQQGMYNNFNGGGMNGVDMFNAILDQSKALSKIIEQNSSQSNNNNTGVSVSSANGGSSNVINIGESKGSEEDVMTLDLLGIGGGGGGVSECGGVHENFFGGTQQTEAATAAAEDEVWRNWSTKNAGFESFSATSNI